MRWQEHRGLSLSNAGEDDFRVSDREREGAVDLLSEHAAQGRLNVEELDARVDGALAARTRAELAALTRDLPVSAQGERPAPQRRATRGALPELSGQLGAFLAVNLVLVAVWALSGSGYFWPAWPILGWGLALVKGGPCVRRRSHRNLTDAGAARRLRRASDGVG